MPPLPSERNLVTRLRHQLITPMTGPPRSIWPTGLEPLDDLLPEGGIRSGSIVEWLSEAGSGAMTLAWLMAAHLQSSRGIIIVDPLQECFPPGIAELGVDLHRMVVLRPRTLPETLWALEQSLRSPSASIVIARLDRVMQQTYRRFKLAVEHGGGIGLFLRPLQCQNEPSWADVRFVCSAAHFQNATKRISLARHVQLQLLHVRGGSFQQRTTLMSINDDACVVSVDSQLARATVEDAAARAS